MKLSDLACVVIDTTVQPKAVMFPTDAKLLNRARERLVRLAKKLGVSLNETQRWQLATPPSSQWNNLKAFHVATDASQGLLHVLSILKESRGSDQTL
jgi:hypothetical protein